MTTRISPRPLVFSLTHGWELREEKGALYARVKPSGRLKTLFTSDSYQGDPDREFSHC